MAFFYNKVMLAGNLTRDPQVRFFANERAVANFGIAINRRYRNQAGEQIEEVTFLDIEAWGRTAELVGQYLTKGSSCFIEGSLKLDQWEDKEGQRRNKLKVVANTVQFLDPRGSNNGGGQNRSENNDSYSDNGSAQASAPSAPSHQFDDDDEPPF